MRQGDPQAPRPTLRTIAFLTGLGVSTVSRALKDAPEISEETRQRVRLIAQQVGYRPNRAGVRLRTGKTHVIALVLNAKDEGSGFFSNFVYGVSEGLGDTGYHLVITPYSSSDAMQPIHYIIDTRAADGVILSRTQPDDPRLRLLAQQGIPFATHGRSELATEHAYFDFDNEAFAFEALRCLANRGRRRIALIGPPPDLTYHKHTHLGFERGLAQFALSGIPAGSCNIDDPITVIRDRGITFASLKQPPDGIVTSSMHASIAIAAGMRARGLVLGEHFDVVTKDMTDLLGIIEPNMIVIPEDFSLAGRELARLLIGAIAGEDPRRLQRLEPPAVLMPSLTA